MSKLTPGVQEILDAVYPLAGQWRMLYGPDYGPLYVLGAIIKDLHADRPRKMDPAAQVVFDALSEIAATWYETRGEDYAPLDRLDQLLAQLRHGAYRDRKPKTPRKPVKSVSGPQAAR